MSLSRIASPGVLTFLVVLSGCSGSGSGSEGSGQGGTAAAVGGAVSAGGTFVALTGGATHSGGVSLGFGGAVTGGSARTGGVNATGGTKASGGTTATGGTKASGGTTATGGTKASGGTTATGGSESRCPGEVYDPTNPPVALTLSGNLGTHDPVMMKSGNTYYEYQTGGSINGKTSINLTAWTGTTGMLSGIPPWVSTAVSSSVTELWAPDISSFGGQYHLFYSASTFGSNKSCIGHATRAALTSGSWTDQGSVVCSITSDNWNAIDPNVIVDTAGTPWLTFGSFWGGIKIVKLTNAGVRADSATPTGIAARPSNGGALEAPFIIHRCGYYYLFVSFDACCKGVDSTYNIRVGRSTSVTGPYTDKAGTAMMSGGGTLLVSGGSRWKGPGHNAILLDGSKTYNVYHAYDADNSGNSVLRISELVWDPSGWPVSGGP